MEDDVFKGMVYIRPDSQRVLEWANDITGIRNLMRKENNFEAGFSLCFLQQCLFDFHKELEEKEKMSDSVPK